MARDHLIDHNKPVFDHFHPKVYMIGLAFVVWFALAAWVLFDHKFDSVDDMALPLAMISALLLFVILLVAALTSVWKRHQLGDDGHAQNVAFRDWRLGNFAIWDGSLKSRDAAIDAPTARRRSIWTDCDRRRLSGLCASCKLARAGRTGGSPIRSSAAQHPRFATPGWQQSRRSR
jgi:hypothetical protein